MKVSICMITYNHEAYVSQAINSILSQSINFDIQLVIGEDRSTDRTREICQDFARQFPEKIKLIISDKNVGMAKNFYRTYTACDGKYIAFCEGDDFWTDNSKLQTQVDFLGANPEFSACFHNVNLLQQRNGADHSWVLHKSLPKDSFTTEDILGPWFIPSPSIVIVNYRDFVLPEWFHNCKYGDLPFMLLLSLRGPFKYLPGVWGTYRLHDSGVSNIDKNYDKVILMTYIYESFNLQTNFRFKDFIRRSVEYEIDRHIVQPLLQRNMPENKSGQVPLAPVRNRISNFKKNLSKMFNSANGTK